MSNQAVTQQIAIIGGGLAGLAAANFLAGAGKNVVVFEKAGSTGGRARTMNDQGFFFNLGAHALYRAGAGAQVLKELGIKYSGGIPRGLVAVDGKQVHRLPDGLVSLVKTGLLGVKEKLELLRLFATVPFSNADTYSTVSLYDWVKQSAKLPQTRNVLLALARQLTYSNAPTLLSAQIAINQVKLALRSNVVYIDGGWQTIVDGLHRKAASSGAQIIAGARVEAVQCNHGGVQGVRLANGAYYAADTVILATDPSTAAGLVDTGRGSILERWAKAAVPVHAACLDLGLRRLPQSKRAIALCVDQPLFLTTQSLYAQVAPDGSALIHALKILDPLKQSSPEQDLHELEAYLDLVQPGWRAEVVTRHWMPRLVVSQALPVATQGGTHGRLEPAVTGVRGLYVAGDWVGRHGILGDASLSSARQAAMAVLSQQAQPLSLAQPEPQGVMV